MPDNRVSRLTSDLVKIPSVLGHESAVAERVAAEMESIGFDRIKQDRLGNVIGIIQGDLPGPTLLLDAHMDTVDVDPAAAWDKSPFSGEILDGKVYGRGSTDMKGSLAAMICAGAELDRRALCGCAVIVGSIGEESTEGTALREVINQIEPDFVIIGEASDLALVRGGRGRAEFCLEVNGKACHAASPERGINAVLEMLKAIQSIETLDLPEHPFVGKGVLCLTDIQSSPYPAQSVVPSGCRATYERRLIPGEERIQVTLELEDACRQAKVFDFKIELAEAAYQTESGIKLQETKWYPAWEIPENHILLQKAAEGLRMAGINPVYSSYQFCTNASYSMGRARIPTIGFGPSRESLAHITNEYVEISQLIRAQKGYASIIRTLLRKV